MGAGSSDGGGDGCMAKNILMVSHVSTQALYSAAKFPVVPSVHKVNQQPQIILFSPNSPYLFFAECNVHVQWAELEFY